MVRLKETEGIAPSYALAQQCEEMARILAWSRSEQEDNKELDWQASSWHWNIRWASKSWEAGASGIRVPESETDKWVIASSSPGIEDKVIEYPEKEDKSWEQRAKELTQQPKKAAGEAQDTSCKPKPPSKQGRVAWSQDWSEIEALQMEDKEFHIKTQ